MGLLHDSKPSMIFVDKASTSACKRYNPQKTQLLVTQNGEVKCLEAWPYAFMQIKQKVPYCTQLLDAAQDDLC